MSPDEIENKLRFTGERVIEELSGDSDENYLIYLFHMVTYKFCLPYVKGKKVLDFGCGSGYGSFFISQVSESVIGVDISDNAIAYSKNKYSKSNLEYKHINKVEDEKLPFPNNEFDVVLSFQVIEHVRDTNAYLAEVHRVLKANGIFIIATPNRSYRLFSFQKPWNKFHVKEYSDKSLQKMLALHFSNIELFQMGGINKVLNFELARTRKVKWLTLPFTLPYTPEWWRNAGLTLLKSIKTAIGRIKRKTERKRSPEFNEDDIFISKSAFPSINIIAVIRK